jgi:ParB family transcriptional regulator, chromosome partitioning protein
MNDEIKLIPIQNIRILNPRHRDRKKFEAIIQSIKNLGLKKPIKVSLRTAQEGQEDGYDLVAGQGRIEACVALGFKEIPAIVTRLCKEDRLLMSLVENLARRFPHTMDLMNEIQRLKAQGDSNVTIGKKLDVANSFIGGLLKLMNAGEERLLDAAIKNKIPLGVAIDIVSTDSIEAQRELLKAYENGQLNQAAIRTLKRLIEHRRFLGKKRTRESDQRTRPTADGLVNTYRRETDRQKALIRKAKLTENKLLCVITAFKKMVHDDNFINLLRAEGLLTMPAHLAEEIKLLQPS